MNECTRAFAQLQVPGQEVRVEVCEQNVTNGCPVARTRLQVEVDIAPRIYDNGRSGLLVDQEVGGLRQAAEVVLFENHVADPSCGAGFGVDTGEPPRVPQDPQEPDPAIRPPNHPGDWRGVGAVTAGSGIGASDDRPPGFGRAHCKPLHARVPRRPATVTPFADAGPSTGNCTFMTKQPLRPRSWLLALLLAVGAPGLLRAAQDAVPTVEAVTERLEALEDSTAPEAQVAREAYQAALDALRRAAEERARTQLFESETAEAPALLETLQQELAEPLPEPDRPDADGLTLEELESLLKQADAAEAASRARVEELDALAAQRAKRSTELPEALAAAQQGLAAVQQALGALPEGADSEARRIQLQAQGDAYTAEIAALEAEREVYEARREVLPLRRDRARRDFTVAEEAAAYWQTEVESRREQEAEAAARRADEQLEDIASRFPQLEVYAAENRALAARRTGESGLPRRLSRARAEKDETIARLAETDERAADAQRRIFVGGLTEAMGSILRADYEWLPRMAELRAEADARERRRSEAELEQMTLRDEREQLGDPLTTAREKVAELGLDPATDPEPLVAALAKLLTERRDAQNVILDELADLIGIYYEHKERSIELRESVKSYREYIEKNILWVRSAPANPIESALAIPGCTLDIARSISLPGLLQDLRESLQKRLGWLILIALLLAMLFAGRGFLRRKREEMGTLVRSFRTDRFVYTLRALVQTLLLALPWPLLAWTIGRMASDSPQELIGSAGVALRQMSKVWLVLRFLRGILAEKGVGAVHFRWPAAGLATVRNELLWFTPLAVVLGFVAFTLEGQSLERGWSDSLGRAAFVAAMVGLAAFLHRLFRAESRLWATAPTSGKGLLGRTHRIWSFIATGLPAALALLAAAGYYYTAIQFELRLRYSIGFALVLILVNALLLRWLFITRRRLAVAQALEAKARREEEEEEAGTAEGGSPALDTDKVDIPAVDAQTRELFKSSITLATVLGLYFIWSSALPALRKLDNVQLWPEVAIMETDSAPEVPGGEASPEVPSSATPSIAPTPLPGLTPVPEGDSSESTSALGLPANLTLADVLLALIFLLLTNVAARNLPALLELALLQRLPLDSGSRYAVSTIVRYLILVVGVSAISGALGVGWQQIQWLAAALTFGLAFGLQEIFANFVSGLIILLERPIRVGDIVTVGSTEGRVTQLRMRATTILDRDRKEYLVPNKEFITSSVINWTLSDPITRLIIPVGIAYGSDTARARSILLRTARSNRLVVDDPAPTAIFMGFGDSTLDFELRVFIANRDFWPEVTDNLNSEIDRAFRAADIEIAFPQRDVHVRSSVVGPRMEAEPDPADDAEPS